jgi:hypothetical protein
LQDAIIGKRKKHTYRKQVRDPPFSKQLFS